MFRQARRSILFGTVMGVVGITLLVGLLFITLAQHIAGRLAEDETHQHLVELLATVESTASIACFVADQQLALEVVRGLLKNTEVAHASLHSGGQTIASAQRGGITTETATASPAVIRHPIPSPFDAREAIGELTVGVSQQAIGETVTQRIRYISYLLALQLACVGLAVVGIVWYVVVHPLTTLSRRLDGLDPAQGQRLQPPSQHEQDEFGLLTTRINALSDRLVHALDQEHTLRLQREVDERKYHALFDNAEAGICVVDRHGALFSWNPSFARLLNMATPPDSALTLTTLGGSDMPALLAALARCDEGNQPVTLESEHHGRWLEFALSPLGQGLVQGLVTDISEHKAAEARAHQQAVTDHLTGLPNRRAFEQQMAAQLTEHPDMPLTLLLLDVDHFQQINSALGLPAGDDVLCHVAAQLRTQVSTPDSWLGRLGSDEFIIILPAVSHETAAHLARTLATQLTQRLELPAGLVTLAVSLGVVRYPDDGSDVATLLRHAELALRQARHTPGTHYSFFDPALVAAARYRQHLEAELAQAIPRAQLQVYYQPIFALGESSPVGAEALLRWQHPEHGFIPPDQFIPLAEENGLITDIGLWVLDSVCEQLTRWRAAGHTGYVSVNVSARQIPQGLSPTQLAAMLARHQLPADCLALEITEGVLLDNLEHARNWMQAMRALGVRLYLDDFGTGYSSLSYLKQFPMDVVKIDKSFIRDLAADSSDRALTAAIVQMASALGLHVVAEGIEHAHQLDLLRDMGCHFGQGYLLSRPMPASALFADAIPA